MVDYYALISPTIEPLAGATPEERQVVYRRLVDMLDQQLRAAVPPRTDKDILREKIELESAIRRIERHVIARQKAKSTNGAPQQSPAPVKEEPLLTSHEIPVNIPIRKDIPGLSRFASTSDDEFARPERETASTFSNESGAIEPQTDGSSLTTEHDALLIAVDDDQTKNIIEPVTEEALPEVVASEFTPPLDEKKSDEIKRPQTVIFNEVPVQPLAPREFFTRPLPASRFDTEAEIEKESQGASPSLPKAFDADYQQSVAEQVQDHHNDSDDHQASYDHKKQNDDQNPEDERDAEPLLAPLPVPEPRSFTPTTGIILAQQKPEPSRSKGLILRVLILFMVLLALMAAVAGVAEFLNRNSTSDVATKSVNDTADTPSSPTKFTDRLPAEPDEPQANVASQTGTMPNDTNAANANPLVTRALLIEEQAGGIGEAKKTEGRVNWKLDTLTSNTTGTADLGVRASIDLTDAGLTASLLFRKNRDLTSANAYLIEVNFQSVGEAANGKIRDIGLPELRPDEKTRGVALAGIPVPVSDNVFLIGLNALPADIKRNIELIQKQNWFFIQIRFATGKRAIILFKKGNTGDRVFEEAIQAWK